MVSRIERFSSILRRAEGLMKGGVMKKKPIWYDVYVKYPPFEEPTVLREKPDIPVNEIFYAEDLQRAERMQSRSAGQTGPGQRRGRRGFVADERRDSGGEERRERSRQTAEERQKKEMELFDLSD